MSPLAPSAHGSQVRAGARPFDEAEIRVPVRDDGGGEVTDRVVETVARTLDLAAAFVALFSDGGQSVMARFGSERDLPLVPASMRDAAAGPDPVVFEDGAAGQSMMRFYAGVPLRSEDGTTLGALCLLDRHPRKLSSGQAAFVRGMAGIVVAQWETQARLARAAADNEHLRAVIASFEPSLTPAGPAPAPGAPRRAASAPECDLLADLERAVARGEFELHYQREVSLASGRTTSAEALLRWRHPQLGLLAPDRFVALAEEAGLMLPIGRWVLGEACAFARRWSEAGGPGVVSVNLSARQFEEPDFVASVVEALEKQRLEPHRLRLELSEDMVQRSAQSAPGRLAELRALGVRAAVDDFGSGYSSLHFMKRLPVDGLKIDRSFMREVAVPDAQPGDEAIVGAILAVGRALRLQVVAAGIETAAQRGFLHARGCEFGQGFLFSRPVRESEFIERAPERAI